jgi:hypothetical protein
MSAAIGFNHVVQVTLRAFHFPDLAPVIMDGATWYTIREMGQRDGFSLDGGYVTGTDSAYFAKLLKRAAPHPDPAINAALQSVISLASRGVAIEAVERLPKA